MSRLPTVGQDDDTWGDILNDYLGVAHNDDGTLKSAAVNSAISDGSITASKLSQSYIVSSQKGAPGGIASLDVTGKVPDSQLPVNSTPDATATSKGLVQLAGDLGGTASLPTVPGLASKYSLPAGGIPEADLDSAVQTKLNSGGVSDAAVAALIQDSGSSTYAALTALIQNIYATSYTPMSVVGARAGGSPPSGAYPVGTAAGDVVVVTVSTNGGLPTPPSGWSTLMTASGTIYYGCAMGVYAKVLDAADVSGGITGWSAGGVSSALHVLRGVLLPTDVLVQNGWTDSTTYQLPTLTATDRAPKLVMTILTSLANQTASIEYPAPYTDFVEFYTGGTSYVAQAVLQASTTASSFPMSDPNGHATWRTVSISLSLTNP